jgi:RNA polymerase sigma-70 factor (ECF subfamily)
MRTGIEHLLRAVEAPDPDRVEALWAGYRAGGPGADGAFATLIAWYGGAIYRRIWGFLRADSADDVFQDVLARLHRERSRLATFADALRWLRKVSLRCCVDAHRRAARRRTRERARAVPAESADLPEASSDDNETLRAALAKLSERERQAVALVFFEGMTRQDAAVETGVHRDTFAKTLDGALARLRSALATTTAAVTATATTALEAALIAHPPLATPVRLVGLTHGLPLASGAWLTERKVLLACVTAGFLAVCGVTVAGRSTDRPPAPTPAVVRGGITAVVELETVPDRNLRVFRAEVLPRQLAALKGVTFGNGGVELEKVEVFDTRLRCDYVLHHRPDNAPAWKSRIRFDHNTIDRGSGVYFDLFGRGEGKPLDTKKPIILWRNPVTGYEVVVPVACLEEARVAFDLLPRDERTAEERRAHERAIDLLAARYVGTWYVRGDPERWRKVRFSDVNLSVQTETDVFSYHRLIDNRFDPAGQHAPVFLGGPPALLSADGRRMTFDGSDEWWSRDPHPKPHGD